MSELTLTIYPRQPRTPGPGKGWADWRRDQDRECKLAHDKRFSDAELAAEWWRSERDLTIHWYDAMACSFLTRECATLLRFASHPHYYEETE